MKRLILLLLFAAPCLAQTVNVPIVDADFESQTLTNGGPITSPPSCGTYQQFNSIVGWELKQIIPGGAGVAHWTCDDGAAPSNVAFLQGAFMEQLLTMKAKQGVYVLQFDVASWFYSYSGDWLAALYMGKLDANGKLVLSPAPFCSSSGWALGDMKRQTVTCSLTWGFINPANAGDALKDFGQVSGNIAIYFQNGVPNPALGGHAGWPILIDNVSLTFTPTN